MGVAGLLVYLHGDPDDSWTHLALAFHLAQLSFSGIRVVLLFFFGNLFRLSFIAPIVFFFEILLALFATIFSGIADPEVLFLYLPYFVWLLFGFSLGFRSKLWFSL